MKLEVSYSEMSSFTTTYKIAYDSMTKVIEDCHRYLSHIYLDEK